MNKSNSGNCLGAADNAMMKRSCSSGGTQEPQIRVYAANVMGLRSKGRGYVQVEWWYHSKDGEEGQVRWRVCWNKREKTGRKDDYHFAADRPGQERVAVAVGEVHS